MHIITTLFLLGIHVCCSSILILVNVSISPHTIMGTAGEQLNLTCNALYVPVSSGIPTFEWLHNGTPLLSSSSAVPVNPQSGSFSNQINLIPLSQLSHGGMITCEVTAGTQNYTAQANVTVTGIIIV